MQTLDDPPHFKIWPYLISYSFLFLKIFPRCYIPIFDGLVYLVIALLQVLSHFQFRLSLTAWTWRSSQSHSRQGLDLSFKIFPCFQLYSLYTMVLTTAKASIFANQVLSCRRLNFPNYSSSDLQHIWHWWKRHHWLQGVYDGNCHHSTIP